MAANHNLRSPAGLLAVGLLAAAGLAEPGPGLQPSTVAVVHCGDILVPLTFLTPAVRYPLGRLDYGVVERLLDCAVILTAGGALAEEAWRSLAGPADKVGILLDAQEPPASLALLDALIDRLVHWGVRPGNIIVWADSERSLFRAGVMIRKDPGGVATMGADSEGFSGGTSRIAANYCHVLINLARLRCDPRIGLWGAVANQLACVPNVERVRLLTEPRQLPAAAARPAIKIKTRLHILDALQPNYAPGPVGMPPYWNCGTILASRDCVALDVVGKGILENKRAEVKGEPWPLEPSPVYLESATTTYRLGQSDPALIIKAEREVVP